MIDWSQLLEERNVWVAKNFPNPSMPSPGESLLGMNEELGELAHAHLKEAQNIRGTPEEHQAEARDAIGDYTIYALGVMNAWGITPATINVKQVRADETLLRLSHATGRISKAYVENSGTGGDWLKWCIHYVGEYARLRGWNYDDLVNETWAHVMKRDWLKDPINAGESQ
jgi:hypothetical protein